MFLKFSDGKTAQTGLYPAGKEEAELEAALALARESPTPVKWCQMVRKIAIPVQRASCLKDLSKEMDFDVSPVDRLFLEHLVTLADTDPARLIRRYLDVREAVEKRIVDEEEV